MTGRRYGLLGEKLGHSYSPRLYQLFGLPEYRLLPTAPEDLPALLRGWGPGGMNVTIPYKKAVMPFCHSLSDEARRLGNVNTLLFGEDGRIEGHNTDYGGFRLMLARAGLRPRGEKVLVLGTGGAAQTARLACLDLGAAEVVLISRRGADSYDSLERHRDARLLVNATPVGMHPEAGRAPLDLDELPRLAGVADLVYNPLRTALLAQAEARGIPAAGGLIMLAEQGRAAAQLFLGREIPGEEALRAGRALQQEHENLVLVGMPGAGKSTVGALLAAALGRPLVDLDAQVRAETGRGPAEWITEAGEPAFRRLEARVVAAAAERRGVVIATGGGAVLDGENRAALRRSGRVYWLRRPLKSLATQGRPLSADLPALYARRRPLYAQACHVQVEASGPPEGTARRIEEEFYASLSTQWAQSQPAGPA